MDTRRRNEAIAAGRLFAGSVDDPAGERCCGCGELLHPYPEPEYWMQYPLPECHILDGLKYCREGPCLDEALADPPRGFERVDLILPEAKAFIVCKWAEQAKPHIEAAKAADEYARETAQVFRVGCRCEIVAMHHRVFSHLIGKRVIVAKVSEASRQVWAYDDKPRTYRRNARGRVVLDHDPKCIQTLYGFDQLRIIP